MIAFFLDLPWYTQAFVVAYVLFCLAIIGAVAWAYFWPLNPDYQCECCADDAPPCLKEIFHD